LNEVEDEVAESEEPTKLGEANADSSSLMTLAAASDSTSS
jgi:hypothetical protein